MWHCHLVSFPPTFRSNLKPTSRNVITSVPCETCGRKKWHWEKVSIPVLLFLSRQYHSTKIFQWHISFWPHHCPGADSVPSENEYQEHSCGYRRSVRDADDLTTFMCRMLWKSGSLNLLEPSGLHRACNGTPSPFIIPPKLHYHLYLYVAGTRRTNGTGLGDFQKALFFRKSGGKE
jgi:hypothetical protein